MKHSITQSAIKSNVPIWLTQRRRFMVVETICAAFILLFVYTGISKIAAIKALKGVLPDYPLIGNYANLIAWGLPILEITIGIMLLIPATKRLGLWAAFIMMALFTVYLAYMFIATPHLPCTCGGMLQSLSWPQHMIFNIMFTTLAMIAIRLNKIPKELN